MIKYDSKKILSIFIIVASLAGYELIVSVLDIIGLKTREFSIFLRALILLASLILLCTNKKLKIKNFFHIKFDWLEILFISFWALYIARLIYTTITDDHTLYMEIRDYWIWAVLVCFIPASSILLLTKKQALEITQNIPTCTYLALSIIIISFSFIFINNISYENNQLINQTIVSKRFEIPSLNPISIANICAIYLLLLPIRKRNDFYQFKFIGKIIFFIIALFFLTITNSKGALIAIFFAAAFHIFKNRNFFHTTLILITIFLIFTMLRAQILTFLELPDRFTNFFNMQILGSQLLSSDAESLVVNNDLSTLDRLSRVKIAFSQILQSPLIGSGIELNGGGGYPHNLFLEIALSTGILGIFLVSPLFFLVFRKGFVTELDQNTKFIFTIFIYYFISAQFSGSIYTSASLWITLSLLVALFKKN